jgi:hypothetical protein
LSQPLQAADPELEEKRRRALYEGLDSLMRAAGARPVFESLPKNAVPYGYPYRVATRQMKKAERELRARGLSSLPWPDLPDEVAPNAPAHYRDVRIAHFLW